MVGKKKPASLELAMAGTAPDATSAMPPPPAKLSKPYEKATVYLPRAAVKRLKQMALDHEKRVNDFLREGVDLMLAKYGERSLDEFDNG